MSFFTLSAIFIAVIVIATIATKMGNNSHINKRDRKYHSNLKKIG